jgi:hypothetical protein
MRRAAALRSGSVPWRRAVSLYTGECSCSAGVEPLQSEVPASPARARNVLGGRSTVGHGALDAVIGVRIPASQPAFARLERARASARPAKPAQFTSETLWARGCLAVARAASGGGPPLPSTHFAFLSVSRPCRRFSQGVSGSRLQRVTFRSSISCGVRWLGLGCGAAKLSATFQRCTSHAQRLDERRQRGRLLAGPLASGAHLWGVQSCFCLTSQSVAPSRYPQPAGFPDHLQTRGVMS